jgi:subtilisin-like proprotein convertase family protein
MIDAAAAVTAATNYTTDLGNFVNTGVITGDSDTWTDPCIVDCYLEATASAPASSNGKIEFVRVILQMDSRVPAGVGFELISPDGTRVPILPAFTSLRNNPAGAEFAIGVNAFYGENMTGTWKLHVNDHVSDEVGGTINSFKIIIYGN